MPFGLSLHVASHLPGLLQWLGHFTALWFQNTLVVILFHGGYFSTGRFSRLNVPRDSWRLLMTYFGESCSNHLIIEWVSGTVQIQEEGTTQRYDQGEVWFPEGANLWRLTTIVLFTPEGTLRILWKYWKGGSRKKDNRQLLIHTETFLPLELRSKNWWNVLRRIHNVLPLILWLEDRKAQEIGNSFFLRYNLP